MRSLSKKERSCPYEEQDQSIYVTSVDPMTHCEKTAIRPSRYLKAQGHTIDKL